MRSETAGDAERLPRDPVFPFIVACVLLLATLAPAAALAAGNSSAPEAGYQLGAGDKISVSVAGASEFDTKTRIRDDGTIGFPYLGDVHVSGLTVPEAEKRIAGQLRKKQILKQPQVSITVEQYLANQVTVLGKVGHPGKYGLTGPTTILDLLARAGGTKEDAANHVVLVRTVSGEKKRYRMTLDSLSSGSAAGTKVRNGDVLIVPRMQTFYIEGAVNKPGQYRLQPNMTVMEAIAVGGGLTPRGSYDRIVVKRQDGDGTVHTYSADVDNVLKPGDLVHVKERIF